MWDPNPLDEGVTHYLVTISSPLGSSEIGVTNSTSFSLDGLQPGVNYTLSVAAVSPLGVSAPSTVDFSLPSGPSITQHPASISVALGAALDLTVSAAGSAPLSFQWFRNGTLLPGQTSQTLHIDAVTSGDIGAYTVRVSNSVDSVESNAATVTLRTGPSIVLQPTGQTVNLGSQITLTVTAAGDSPLTYRWYRNNTSISGATSPTYQITSAATGSAGQYFVRVTNPVGSVDSTTVTVVVQTPPTITSQPRSVTVNEGSQVSLAVTATGTTPFTYQWSRNGTPLSGRTSRTLVIQAATIADEGSYTVRVTNPVSSIESNAASVNVDPAPVAPTIVSDPESESVAEGGSATFTVLANGTAPLAYQWYKDDVLIAGATSVSLTLATVSPQDEGSYTVRVTNAAGNDTSVPAVLEVIDALSLPVITWHPEPNILRVGQPFEVSVAAQSGEPVQYQWLKDGVEVPGATNSVYSVAVAQASQGGSYQARVSNSAGFVLSDPAMITIRVAPQITQDLSPATVNEGAQLRLALQVTGTRPFTVQWYRNDGLIGTTAEPELVIPTARLQDDGAYFVRITGPGGTATSTPARITIFAKPVITTHPQGALVAVGAGVTLNAGASGSGLTWQWLKGGQPVAGATSSTLTIAAMRQIDFGTYSARVSNAAGSAESNPAVVELAAAPVLQTNPASVDLLENSALTLSVVVTGTSPFTYQWFKNGQTLAGETAATFQRGTASTADSGAYHVTISNPYGLIRSATATVRIISHLAITRQPVATSVTPGSPLTLSVEATSGLPLTYQWFRDGSPLAGRTAATLQIPAAALSDSGSYHVSVRNALEEILSQMVAVTVAADQSGGVLTISTTPVGGGDGLTIVAIGAPNTVYEIQETTNLSSWTTTGTVTSDSNGRFQVDPQGQQTQYRFIRTVRR